MLQGFVLVRKSLARIEESVIIENSAMIEIFCDC